MIIKIYDYLLMELLLERKHIIIFEKRIMKL